MWTPDALGFARDLLLAVLQPNMCPLQTLPARDRFVAACIAKCHSLYITKI